MNNFNLFIPITKIDVAKREVYGIATKEQVDKSGEIMDYATTKPHYKDWSAEIHKASGGKSLGNVRAMHGNVAAGKLTQMVFNDELKQIEVCAKIVDDAEWKKVEEGVYTGFSHGGEYVKRWKDQDDATLYRYTAKPSEISIVDNPCLGSAVFELIRADGTKDMVKFKTADEPKVEDPKTVEDGKAIKPKHEIEQVWKASDNVTFAKRDDCAKYQLKIEATGGDTTAELIALSKAIDDKDGGLDDAKIEAAHEVIKRKDAFVAKFKESASVAKGWSQTYDCKTAIDALCLLECLISGEEWDALMGQGGDTQVADLKDAISRIKAFIAAEILEGEEGDVMAMAAVAEFVKKYVTDEVATKMIADIKAEATGNVKGILKAGARHSSADKGHLATALGHLESAKDGHEDVTKHFGKMADSHESLNKCFGKLEECMKIIGNNISKDAAESTTLTKEAAAGLKTTLDEAETHLEKAVKIHGKMGKAHNTIGASHDGIGSSLEAVGAEAGTKEGDEDEATKALKADMAKLTESVTALTKSNEELVAKNAQTETDKAELQKNFDKVNELIPVLKERVDNLEKTPLPRKGALYEVPHDKTVALGKDHGGKQPDNSPVEVAPGTSLRSSPEEQRRLMGITPAY